MTAPLPEGLLGYNLSSSTILCSPTENDIALEPTNWDQALEQAIVAKNVHDVQRALDGGADPKKMVHKDKMAVFVMRHFDQHVAELMAKKTPFGDIAAITDAIWETDNPEAMVWFLTRQKSCQMNFQAALSAKATKCLVTALKDPVATIKFDPAKLKSIPVQFKDVHSYSLLMDAALEKNEPQLLAYMSNIYTEQDMEEGLITWMKTQLSMVTLSHLHVLEQWLTSDPKVCQAWTSAWHNMKPGMLNEKIGSNEHGCRFHIDGTTKLKSILSWDKHHLKCELDGCLWSLLLAFAAPAIQEAIASPKGQELGARLLEKPSALLAGLSKMKKPAAHALIKALIEDHPDWRDSKGNNLLHVYAASASEHELSATFYKDMLTLDRALFSATNNLNLAPSLGAPPQILAQLQRTKMRKVLREHGLTRNRPQSTKRKM